MNTNCTMTGLMLRFQRLFALLAFYFFSFQLACAAPIVISVDHLVTVSYSRVQFDASKGVYSTQVRIKNHSSTAMLTPLRLAYDQAALKNIRLQNAHGIGKDGKPYFEFTLPREMLKANEVAGPVKVVIAAGKEKMAAKGVLSILARAQRVSAGTESALLKPNASPSDLPANSGKKAVQFSVPLLGKDKSSVTVYLRRSGDKNSIAMNDLGKDGDVTAKDGIHGVVVQIDTSKEKPDSCVRYEAFIKQGRDELVSPPLQLCVSSFPVQLAESNIVHPAVFPDGSKAVADEILLTVKPGTTAAAIRQLARSINANVVGSYLSMNLYQFKLPSPLKVAKLLEIAAQLRARAGVVSASINAIGQYALGVNDPEFNLLPTDINSQHGLKLVLAHNQTTNANAWDGNSKGSGVTAVVLDSGLGLTHLDLDPTWTCQLASGPALVACSDLDGHGTQVAGVLAAKTNNVLGVAGLAFNSRIHSIQVSANANVVASQMITGLQAVRDYVAVHPEASVINASFAAGGGSATAADWALVCGAIEAVVFNGIPRAVVVNAAGNNNVNAVVYPARCKDMNVELVHKDLLITVSNSTSVVTAACGSVPVDQRCSTSNYGAWVDMAAPGSAIRTTTLGNTYASPTGNSFSAPMVAGAAAILRSCGMPPELIRPTLTTSANVLVPYPAFGANPAGSTKRLDLNRALHTYATSASNSSTPETYVEDIPLDLANILVDDLDACETFTATLTLSDPLAGALSTATSGAITATFVGGVWSASGPLADVNALLAGVTFNPALNYNSNFNIATSVSGGITPAVTGSKAMTGTAVNDAPAANADTLTATEDMAVTYPAALLLGNDTDVDGPALSIASVISGTGGTVTLNGDGTVTFNPNLNFNGAASFTYTATDGTLPSNMATVTVNVAPMNDAPVANADTLTATEDMAVTYPAALLLGNDTDVDGPALSIASVTSGTGGTVTLNGDGTVTFNPNLNFNGAASFTYSATDGTLPSNIAAVTVNVTSVNDAPVPVPDILPTVSQNSGSHTFAFVDLTGNDDDGDPEVTQLLTVIGVSNPVGGTAALDGMGNVVFALTMGFNGTASFNYTVQDDGQTNGMNDFKTAIGSASFTVTAAPVNNPPSIANQTFAHIEYNQVDPAASPLFDDFVGIVGASDPEGAPLTFSITGGNELTVNGILQSNAFRFDAAILGRLLVDNRLALNYEFLPTADPSFNLSVEVSDGVNTVPATVKVTLTNDGFDNGDPHITTARGLRYDFQSAGEFVALRGGNGMEIQTRQTAIPGPAPFTDPYSGLAVGVSVNTAVAARVGNHRVTYQGNSSGVAELRIDGAMTTLPANGIDLGYGGRVAPLGGNGIQVDFPDGTTMTVTAYPWGSLVYMQVQVMHTPAREGIMGLHTQGSWLPRLSSGSSFGAMPASLYDRFVQLYETFADSWRVTDATSLFDYVPGASTSTFTHVWPTEKPPAPPQVSDAGALVATPVKAPRGVVLRPVAKQVARQHCRAIIGKQEKANCIFDVMVTGNIHFVRAYQGVERIKAGLTSVEIRNNRVITRDDAPVTYTATVARHSAEIRKEGDLLSTHAIKSHAAPIGTVQFMLNGKVSGKSVKLDVNGQARMKMPRNQVGKQHVGARYIPADGSVYLPSSSRNLSGSVEIASKKTRKKG